MHDDDAGHRGAAVPGTVQVLSAGRGVVHSERCEVTTRFVQSWVLADTPGGEVGYATAQVEPADLRNRLATVASGAGAGVAIGCRGVALLAGRLDDGVTVELPDTAFRQVFVAVGAAELGSGQTLAFGDAARITGGGPLTVTARGPCEVLAWALDDTVATGVLAAHRVG